MTLEEIKEAVEVIKAYRQMLTDSVSNQIDGDIKAFDVAVEAMERESCDAISRQAVEAIINDIRDCISVEGYCAILERMKKLPPVNLQPKMGHWIEVAKYSDGKHKIECSKCGNHIFDRGHANSYNVRKKYKYCPVCGVKMVEERSGKE